MVRPFIAKRNTVMRGSISANERLAIALCYLVSGRSFTDLQYSGIMATSTFSLIVQETYEGIIIALHDYIKVAITRLIIACNVQFIFNHSFELHDIDYQKFGCTGIHENIELGVPVEYKNPQTIFRYRWNCYLLLMLVELMFHIYYARISTSIYFHRISLNVPSSA